MYSVDVVFSAFNDPQGNPQWWDYTVTTRGLDNDQSWSDSMAIDAEDVEMGIDSLFADLANIEKQYWINRQLAIF